MEWGSKPESCDFTVWTYIYDHGGLKNVILNYRTHPGVKSANAACGAYSGGEWHEIPLQGKDIPAQTSPKPLYKAAEFSGQISGLKDTFDRREGARAPSLKESTKCSTAGSEAVELVRPTRGGACPL
jgi:hypothetical protein